MKHGMHTLDNFDPKGKVILCRVDINSPIDKGNLALRDITRIKGCLPTIQELSDKGARLVLMSHQGGDLEYKNYATTKPHGEVLSTLLNKKVDFIDDVTGPAARERIRNMQNGDILLLDNVRFLAEEMTLFETKIKLSPEEQAETLVVRKLAPLAHLFVCDAFAAVHRSQPTLVGFPEVLPSAMGRLFEREVEMLSRITEDPERPALFILGGSKIQDAFLMMEKVLADGIADWVLTGGLVANIMLSAKGISIGKASEEFLQEQNLAEYANTARKLLQKYDSKILVPSDLAYVREGIRYEALVDSLPDADLLVDLGQKTVEQYKALIKQAKTIFINGPAGIFEEPESEYGTRQLLEAIAEAEGFSLIGGGDSISAINKFKLTDAFSYVCTAGGGMVRFVSGEELPVIKALKKSAVKYPLKSPLKEVDQAI